MEEPTLMCALLREGGTDVFPVVIGRSKVVGLLKDAIKAKKTNDLKDVDADKLRLFLAKKGDAWLPDDDNLHAVLQGQDFSSYLEMRPSWKLAKPSLFGPNVSLGEDVIHVLVVAPKPEQPQARWWLLSGSFENALNTKGTRCRLYRLAASYLGYYDPARRVGEKDVALWYDDEALRIHCLYKSEENALLFENTLQDERITQMSPLNGLALSTSVVQISGELSGLQRIFSYHYDPHETASPQNTMSSMSGSATSIVEIVSDEFRYQRIEGEEWFGHLGKAESCHLMSRKRCRESESYLKYDADKSNRLALSSEMHSWYDGLNVSLPVMNISVSNVSPAPVNGKRYKVDLIVRAIDATYAKLISMRLKEGSVVLEDRLEMQTSVYVINPRVFCKCMSWKNKDTEKKWKEYFDMAPAVD